ncbi:MAG: translocation/assembly module TamB domain-containing protein [Polaromonas sp.]|uniref:translocation/assembly module TamB domain-containing protein n=1 Tax=Polaromonas sp. TaxID=1869339 RepID=UPI0027190C30|nr:translocation/assembly module TamB domain-containing protein [Polaromonas sp.]MDO9115514.1 translocation/assembly module TamB domain-containing protein [Polaromonas sp.]MDP1887113.1 translocation/assembly module TamB domain-containing protein [Polaromonas sp.]
MADTAPTTASAPTASSRKPPRRWRTALAATGAALLAVLLSALAWLWWWSGTEGSLAYALRWAAVSQPLSAEGVSGSLRAGGQVQTLRWQQERLQLVASDVQLRWQPLSLLSGTLRLERLAAASLTVDDQRPPAEAAAGPPASVALPFRITLEELAIDRLLWLGPPALEAKAIRARYAFDGVHHQVELANADFADGRYTGRATLLATGALTLDAAMSGVLEAAVPGSAARLPLAFQATAKGPLAELQASGELKQLSAQARPGDTPQASATARITPWAAQPLPQADATFVALDLASLWPGAPQTGLSGSLSVRPDNRRSDAWQLQTDVKNSLPGPWDQQRLPLDKLQAEGEWRGGVAMVRNLQARLGGGEITASGQWSEAAPATAPATASSTTPTTPAAAGAQDWQVQATLKNINPAALHTQLAALPVDGRADVKGQAGAIVFDAGLAASGKTAAPPTRTTNGALTALRLRDASATGRWAGDTLTLSTLQLRADDAELAGTLEVQPAARSGKGRLDLTAPGLAAQVQGELQATRGAGKLSLRGRDAAQALRWLQRLPGAPAALQQASASGSAELQLSWQGGWRDPALQASLSLPALDWRSSAAPANTSANKTTTPASPAAPAVVLQFRAVQATLSGRLSQAELKLQGRLEQQQRRYALQLAASGGRSGPAPASLAAWTTAPWQALVQQLQVSVEDPALGAGAWRLATQKAVPLKWTPTSAGGALEAGAGQALLSAPARAAAAGPASQATLAWQPVRWRAGELLTAGTLTGLPLAWLELFAGPQLAGAGLAGDLVFDGQWDAALGNTLRLKASLARSRGDLTVQAETAQGSATRVAAGVKEARLTLDSQGDALTLGLRWDSERAGSADGQLTTRLARSNAGWAWPADAPLNGRLRAQLPRIGVWSVLAPPGWRLRGSLAANIALSGNRAEPQLAGTLQADDLALRSVVDGIEFGKGTLRATLDGTRMRISEFTLQGAGGQGTGGLLRAKGEAGWIDGKPEVRLDARLERLRASLRTDRELTVSGDLQASLVGRAASLTGRLLIDQASILLPDESTPQLGDDVVVRSSSGAAAGKKAPAEAHAPAAAPAGQDGRSLNLAVQIDLGQDFRIRGKGLDTRVQGTLALSGESLGSARLNGTVRTVGGQYRAYGQRLDVEQGQLRFTGAIDNPTLDILAIRPNLTQRVGVQITGTALLPRVRLYAQPELSDAEKLSWLVVGRASASGGAEAALLQQAAIALLGSKAGGMSGGLAASLGLDELSFRGASSNTDGSAAQGAVTLGKRFSRNFYAAYERSLSGALGTLYLFYDLSQRFTLRAEAGQQSAVDLIYTVPFD